MSSPERTPLYWRMLRLRAIRPGTAMRVALVEGLAFAGVLLALAGATSVWAILVLPIVAAVVVKANDLIAVQLTGRHEEMRTGS